MKISELLEKPFRYNASYVCNSYKVETQNDQIQFFVGEKEVDLNTLAEDLEKIVGEYKTCLDISVTDESSALSKGLFYMEQQLEDFIIQNNLTKGSMKLIFDENEFNSLSSNLKYQTNRNTIRKQFPCCHV